MPRSSQVNSTVRNTVAALILACGAVPSALAQQPAVPSTPPALAPAPALPAPAATAEPEPPAKAEADAGTPATVIDNREIESVLGRSVLSPTGEDLGRIVDLLVDHGGKLRAAVIDFGGFFGVGSRKIAVDWHSLHFKHEKKADTIVADLPNSQLRVAPVYKEDEPVVVLGRGAPPATPAPPPVAAPASFEPRAADTKPAETKPADTKTPTPAPAAAPPADPAP